MIQQNDPLIRTSLPGNDTYYKEIGVHPSQNRYSQELEGSINFNIDNSELKSDSSDRRAWVMLVLSSICGGLGNSLEVVSPLVWIQFYFLVRAFDDLSKRCDSLWEKLLLSFFICITQGLGTLLGFSGLFGYPENTIETSMMAFGAGVIIAFLMLILALWPHFGFSKRFPSSVCQIFIFPVGLTVVYHVIVESLFSAFPSPGNAVLDYAPLRQLAALVGVTGITFMVGFLPTCFVLFSNSNNHRHLTRRVGVCIGCGCVVLFLITGFVIQADTFYQIDVNNLIPSPENTLSVSCVLAQGAEIHSKQRDLIWNKTISRASLGDDIILWAEESFFIESDIDESAVISRAQHIAAYFSTYLGITYMKQLPQQDMGTNRFVLLSSTGDVVWNYAKAFPVPGVETNIQAGEAVVPTHNSPYGILAGAICFDLDFPQYIRQAGQAHTTLLLQPSWTWGALSSRHFNNNAVRSVENGFSIFRCSSNGESGIVGPSGKVLARMFTGDDPLQEVHFTLPLAPRLDTMFTNVGFAFVWVNLAVAIFFYSLILLPKKMLSWVLIKLRFRMKEIEDIEAF